MNDNIHANVMLVELRVSQWTGRKMDKRVNHAVAVSNQVDEAVGRYYKSLLDPSIIKRITSLVNEARKAYYKRTLPWSDDGPRILTAAIYFEFMQCMQDYRVRYEATVSEFLRDYPFHREEAKRYLGSLFNDDDYPEPEKLSEKFGFKLVVNPLPVSADFRCAIGSEEVERVKAEIEAQTRATLQQSVRAAFDRVLEVAAQYADRLSEPGNIFRNSMVDKARELVEIMPKLNFTNDPELTRLTALMAERVAAHDPDVLRNSETAREQASSAAKSVVSDIEAIFGGAVNGK